jgi:hypothetical protein
VESQLVETGGPVFVRGLDSFTHSAAGLAIAHGRSLVVLVTTDELTRISARFGSEVVCHNAEDLDEASACLTERGATELLRNCPSAVVDGLRRIASEVARRGVRPEIWVLPDLGVGAPEVRSALSIDGLEPYLELVRVGSEPSTSPGESAALRARLQEWEGLSLSEGGVEIVEASLHAADEVAGEIVALVPGAGTLLTH